MGRKGSLPYVLFSCCGDRFLSAVFGAGALCAPWHPGVYHKSVKDLLSKKIFCLVACFFDFFKKTGDQTLFYLDAGGGEILVTHPHPVEK
jgi:hypothetical protein